MGDTLNGASDILGQIRQMFGDKGFVNEQAEELDNLQIQLMNTVVAKAETDVALVYSFFKK
jgi:hypothetical protein